MKKSIYVFILFAALFCSVRASTPMMTDSGDKQGITKMAHRLLGFIENKGQIKDSRDSRKEKIEYFIDYGNVHLYFSKSGWSTVIYSHSKNEDRAISEATCRDENSAIGFESSLAPSGQQKASTANVLQVTLLEGNSAVSIQPFDQMSAYANFYYPNCPDGITHVRCYGGIKYNSIYNGIDLVLYASSVGLKYEFVVHPGGDPNNIKLKIDGASSILSDGNGVVYEVGDVKILDGKISTYINSGSYDIVPSSYTVDGTVVGFKIANYDGSKTIVIDPWSTYYGGSGLEDFPKITLDRYENIIFACSTMSLDMPVLNAFQDSLAIGPVIYRDAYIAKLDSVKNIQWCTYYGGSSVEYWLSICADTSGNIILGGATSSTDLPIDSAWQSNMNGLQDGFLAKFNSTGERLWATFNGGYSEENVFSVGVDRGGNVYTSGVTSSPDYPVLDAYQSQYGGGSRDAFYCKYMSNGRQIYSSFLGGSGNDFGYAIAVDSTGRFVITGGTSSTNFPVVSPFQANYGGGPRDAFITWFDSAGVPIWSTYYGGSASDYGSVVCLSVDNHILIAGATTSDNFHLCSPSQPSRSGSSDIFIIRFSYNEVLRYASYFGGSDGDGTNGLASDSDGNIYLAGSTMSRDFPVFNAVFPILMDPITTSVPYDGFLTKMDSSGTVYWSTYLGGTDDDRVTGLSCAQSLNIYCVGETMSMDFPIYNGLKDTLSYSPNESLKRDLFITCFDQTGAIPIVLSAISASCQSGEVTLQWKTMQEDNAYGFTVERSLSQGREWNERGFIASREVLGMENTYSWQDRDPGTGVETRWYRLRMIDNDGTSTYSPVIKVECSQVANLAFDVIYPNPVHDEAVLNITMPSGERGEIVVRDINGRECKILHISTLPSASTTSYLFPVSDLRPGLYFVTLATDHAQLTRKMLVLN